VKSGKKRTEEMPVTITINGKTLKDSSDHDAYEDPYYAYKENDIPAIFTTQFALFYALTNLSEVFNYIDEKYHSLAKTLSEQKNEDIQNAIYQLLDQTSFKSRKGLPKYLQIVPIKSLIDQSIFIHPTETEILSLLHSFTMDMLKGYCDKLGIKPARSKKEIVDRLLKTNIKVQIDFEQYFKLNPSIREIYNQFGNYCSILIEKRLDETKIRIKEVNKKINPEELGDEIKKGEYSMQDYGYKSVIFFKNKQPIFRIMGVTVDKWDESVILFNNGRFGIVEYLRIDKWIMMQISVVNENKEILARYKVKDVSSYHISELEEQPFIFKDLVDGRYWILNYETLEEKYLDNFEDLDVYSLIENKWGSTR
jgi:hypothetical protein